MKKLLKKIIPEPWILFYHKTLAKYAAYRYKYPSEKLIVIGVTGTKGKSTTCNIIWHLLTEAGFKVGLATTVNFKIDEKEWLNNTKMTMLGRTQLQKLLSDMVEAGCQYAIVETSSEGIKQFRHININYDIGVFTNLHPEHIDAHGSFENYKQAKLDFFKHISDSKQKTINGQAIPKAVVINGDSKYAAEFAQAAQVSTRFIWTTKDDNELPINLKVSNIEETKTGVCFNINDYEYQSSLLGKWNAGNIISALAVVVTQGTSYPQLIKPVASIPAVPGRMELVEAGQPYTVVVDYAYEPKSLELLYKFWKQRIAPDRKMITLISSTGGGRDVWRRPVNGKVATELCDYIIITDEDPYDEVPQTIIDQVAEGAIKAGAKENENMWRILDRTEAIEKACSLAEAGDVVFLTAKGAEQKMCVAKGKKVDWDDRKAARKAIEKNS